MSKLRGPITEDLLKAIEETTGITKVSCHKIGRDYCCTAEVDTNNPYVSTQKTSGYGANRLHALVRLLIRINELKSVY